MTKAIHIIAPDVPRDCLQSLALLVAEADVILSVGPAQRCDELRRQVQAVHAPLGSPAACGRRIAGFIGDADLIHAWSPTACRAAREAARLARLPVLYSLPCLPNADDLRYFLEPACAGLVGLTVPTEASRRSLLRCGAPEGSVHVLPPAAEPISHIEQRRLRVREALGADESDFILVAPDEMIRDAGHMYASWAHAIVRAIRPGVRLFLPGGGPAFRSVKFFAGTTGYDDEVFITEDRFGLADTLAAADGAVFFQRRDSGVSTLASAMAAGLPIAASRTPDAAECTDSGAAAILADPGEGRTAAAAMLKLTEDGELTDRLSDAAKAIAAERFAVKKCRAKLEEIYQIVTAGEDNPKETVFHPLDGASSQPI